MPCFSTRSSASFTTSSMSTSFLSSSSSRMRRASGTFTVRRFFRFGIISCSISVKLKSVPSIPCGGCIISMHRGSSAAPPRSRPRARRACPSASSCGASRACAAAAPRGPAPLDACPARTPRRTRGSPCRPPAPRRPRRFAGCGRGSGGSSRSSSRSSARSSACGIDLVLPLGAHHVDRARPPGRAPSTRRRGRRSPPR